MTVIYAWIETMTMSRLQQLHGIILRRLPLQPTTYIRWLFGRQHLMARTRFYMNETLGMFASLTRQHPDAFSDREARDLLASLYVDDDYVDVLVHCGSAEHCPQPTVLPHTFVNIVRRGLEAHARAYRWRG